MHPPASPLAGFIDESVHTDVCLYVVGLVLADPGVTEEVRKLLCAVIPTARPPHWSKEDKQTRAALIREVAALPISARVYGCRYERPKRKEAARSRALTWLVQELPRSVRCLVLAEREASQDRHDRRVLGGLAGRAPAFTYSHAPIAKEPLLWAADVIVSSTAKALARREDPRTQGLGRILTHVGCEPR
ncbi:hypothetical protein GCM10009677_32990 [Sphaerisporangium rubeum]|uniref:DUF3800 domain-containing protein n=1 Tax=Sphaerisporangium rubeum TaxID=321317 RepID=A0A7X0M7Z3_9ACTN|nr:hypothetical protein [Sphaerisporangium rubeum]MBB6474827.1 hypothetical protein [Sphaerisporangium rubeum]